MNTFVKAAIAGALSLGATGAFAGTSLPWTNSSDLLLVVENTTSHVTYALDTGISLSSIMPTGQLNAQGTATVLNTTNFAGINQTIAASAGLQSFLAANPASGDAWTLEGGQYNGNGSAVASNANTKPTGAAIGVFTSLLGTETSSNVTTKVLGNLQGFENNLNNDLLDSTKLGGLTSAAEISNGSTTINDEQHAFWAAVDFASLGSSAIQLFGFTGNGTTGQLQSYILGSATMGTDGKLTISGNSAPTPLPAAVWLFGSGLLGLFGVSRRRVAA